MSKFILRFLNSAKMFKTHIFENTSKLRMLKNQNLSISLRKRNWKSVWSKVFMICWKIKTLLISLMSSIKTIWQKMYVFFYHWCQGFVNNKSFFKTRYVFVKTEKNDKSKKKEKNWLHIVFVKFKFSSFGEVLVR